MANLPGIQVLLTTHSSYVVKKLEYNDLRIISNDRNTAQRVIHVEENYLKYPSLNEVNYLAFRETTPEYLNELYASLHEIANTETSSTLSIAKFDAWLCSKGLKQDTEYIWDNHGKKGKTSLYTLPTCVRHKIHHPENEFNHYDDEQLKQSVLMLRNVYCQILA